MKKVLYLLLILLTLTAACLRAEDEEEAIVNLPMYPGSSVETSADITSKEIPTLVKILLSRSSERASKVSDKDIEEAVKGIERMRVLTVTEIDGKPKDVAKFYSENLPEGKWSKLYAAAIAKGAVGIYTAPEADSMYFYAVFSDPSDGNKTRKAAAIRLDGKPDFIKLAALFMKTVI